MKKITDFEIIEEIIKGSSIDYFKDSLLILTLNDNMSVIFDTIQMSERFIYFSLNYHSIFIYKIK